MQLPHPPLPGSGPPWLTAPFVAIVTTSMSGAVLAAPVVHGILSRHEALSVPLLAFTTFMLSIPVGRFALRAATPGRAVGRAMFVGALMGSVNAGFGVAWVVGRHNPAAAVPAFLFGSTIGALLGAPLGAAFGCWYSFTLAPLADRSRAPAHDDVHAVSLRGGVALALSSAIAFAWQPANRDVWAVASAGELLALCILQVTLWSSMSRRAWVREVLRGVEPQWQAIPVRAGAWPADVLTSVPPMFRAMRAELLAQPDEALAIVRRPEAPEVPYRTAPAGVPVGRVVAEVRPHARRAGLFAASVAVATALGYLAADFAR